MRGLAVSSSPGAAIGLFTAMRRAGAAPDAFSFTFVFKSCSRCFSLWRSPSDLHAQAIKHGCLGARSAHTHVHNALLHAYASRAPVDDARRVFDEMPVRDVVAIQVYFVKFKIGFASHEFKYSEIDIMFLMFFSGPC